jgi:hypothetical protein
VGHVASVADAASVVSAPPAVKAAPAVAVVEDRVDPVAVEDLAAGDPVDPADRAAAIEARVDHAARRIPTGMTQAVLD